jgi:hypothetical protein
MLGFNPQRHTKRKKINGSTVVVIIEIPNKKQSRAGGEAQVIVCLPSKHKTLSSILSTAQTTKTKKETVQTM